MSENCRFFVNLWGIRLRAGQLIRFSWEVSRDPGSTRRWFEISREQRGVDLRN
jgi:hypothetical protein